MSQVKYTDKNIPYDSFLVQRFDLLIKRCTQKKPRLDSLLLVEGGEGSGKTTMSVGVAYYVHWKTGRKFSEQNVFADTKKAIEFAQNNEEQIIIFDEPALDALSAEWWKDTQKDLIKLLMLSRKKRHFFIFNLTKFYKFAEYIVVDRAMGMIHLYTNYQTNQPQFSYIRKDDLERLYNDYRRMKVRNYRKYTQFVGDFADVLDSEKGYNVLDIFNIDNYEKAKDLAILSIGKKVKKDMLAKARLDLRQLRHKIGNINLPITTKTELCKQIGTSLDTLKDWSRLETMEKEPKKDREEDSV